MQYMDTKKIQNLDKKMNIKQRLRTKSTKF